MWIMGWFALRQCARHFSVAKPESTFWGVFCLEPLDFRRNGEWEKGRSQAMWIWDNPPPNFEIWDNLSWEHVTFGLLDLWNGQLTVERTLILLDSLFRGFYWTNGCGKWRLLLLSEKMHEQTWISMFLKVKNVRIAFPIFENPPKRL